MARARVKQEINTKRRSDKERKRRTKQIYAAMIKFINKTYGTLTELQDFLDAVLQGVYFNSGKYKGKALGDLTYSELLQEFNNGNFNDLDIDIETVVYELFLTNLTDFIYGKAGSLVSGLENAATRRSIKLISENWDGSLEDMIRQLTQPEN